MIYEYPKTPFTVFASHAPSHLGRQAGGSKVLIQFGALGGVSAPLNFTTFRRP